MNIYKLDHDASYEVFGLFNEDDWDVVDMLEKYERLHTSWPTIRVRPRLPARASRHGLRLSGDFPYLGSIIPIFSARAVKALKDLLEPNGEILPLDCLEGEYFAYNILTVLDGLDESGSDVERFESSGRIMRVNRYEFVRTRVQGVALFTLPQLCKSTVFVNDQFVLRVREVGLLGFEFPHLWVDRA